MIFADNIKNTDHLEKTFAHETAGHKGLQALLGKEYTSIIDEIYSAVNQKHGAELQKLAATYGQDLNTVEGQRYIIEEYLADQADLQKLSGFKSFVQKIKLALRKVGFRAKWTDDEIATLMRRSLENVRKQRSPRTGNGIDGVRFMLDRKPESIDDFLAMPAHDKPSKVKFENIKELYDIYKREYLGKTIETASGHHITFKPGHFFRLIAGTPKTGERKGYISKASSPENAIELIERNEINQNDIAGFEYYRAENILLFKDVLIDADFWYEENKGQKNTIVYGKKYKDIKKADGFIGITLDIGNDELGILSFHPRDFKKLLENKKVNWNIINSIDHMNATGDVSSIAKSSDLTYNIDSKDKKVKSENEKNQENIRKSIAPVIDNGRKMNYLTGELLYSIDEGEIILENIEVPLEDRRKGIGKKLIEALLQKAYDLDLPITGYMYPQDNETTYEDLKNFYDAMSFDIDSDDMLFSDGRNTGVFTQNAPDNGNVRFSIAPVWTGSAADYDKPSLHAVGTGEGQQVYGWGLYGSESRSVAEWYAEKNVDNKYKQEQTLFKGKPFAETFPDTYPVENVEYFALSVVDECGGNIDYVINVFNERVKSADGITETDKENVAFYQKCIEFLENNKENIDFKADDLTGRRHVYQQTFWADKQENLLDWDKPVNKKQKNLIIKQAKKEGLDISNILWDGGKIYGNALYNYLQTRSYLGSPKAASEFLYRAGIDGITYIGDSSGVRNYVAFSDEDIRIDEHIRFSVSDGDGFVSTADKENMITVLMGIPKKELDQMNAASTMAYLTEKKFNVPDENVALSALNTAKSRRKEQMKRLAEKRRATRKNFSRSGKKDCRKKQKSAANLFARLINS